MGTHDRFPAIPDETRPFMQAFPQARLDPARVAAVWKKYPQLGDRACSTAITRIHDLADRLGGDDLTASRLAELTLLNPAIGCLPARDTLSGIRYACRFMEQAGIAPPVAMKMLEREPRLMTLNEGLDLARNEWRLHLAEAPDGNRRGATLSTRSFGQALSHCPDLPWQSPGQAALTLISLKKAFSPCGLTHGDLVQGFCEDPHLLLRPAADTVRNFTDARPLMDKTGLQPIDILRGAMRRPDLLLRPLRPALQKIRDMATTLQPDGLTVADLLAASIENPDLQAVTALKAGSNMKNLMEEMHAAGINPAQAKQITLDHPELASNSRAQRQGTVQAVATYFAPQGYTEQQCAHDLYTKAPYVLRKGPRVTSLFDLMKQEFGPHGMTDRGLFDMYRERPHMASREFPYYTDRIHTVSKRYAGAGLTYGSYAGAACQSAELFFYDPDTICSSIDGHVDLLRSSGMTPARWIAVALKRPELFRAVPQTTASYLMPVAGPQAATGIALPLYLDALDSQPQLYYQRADVVLERLPLVASCYADGLAQRPTRFRDKWVNDNARVLAYPRALCWTHEHIALRRVWARLTSPDEPRADFFRATKGDITGQLKDRLGPAADLDRLASDELHRVGTSLGLAFTAVTRPRNPAGAPIRVDKAALG